MEGRAVSPPSFRIFISMRNTIAILMLALLSSCVVERTVIEHDDTYVWRRQEVPPLPYRPRNYDRRYTDTEYFYVRPFSRPLWYSYPYWNQPATVIIVPRQENNLQQGRRPDRGSLPNHNRNQITPRRGRN